MPDTVFVETLLHQEDKDKSKLLVIQASDPSCQAGSVQIGGAVINTLYGVVGVPESQ